jgi:hypothetical protein
MIFGLKFIRGTPPILVSHVFFLVHQSNAFVFIDFVYVYSFYFFSATPCAEPGIKQRPFSE